MGYDRAQCDVQVATAKQYPRDMTRCINNALTLACIDADTAQTMGYALPRGGKPLMGPSVHLAKLLAQQWGNLRVEARVTDIGARQITARGTAWDLESNSAISVEVKRSIVNKYGKRLSDDMITVVGNAAASIALRNAILAIIPKQVTDRIYNESRRAITGDLSDEAVLIKRRQGALQRFKDDYNITEDEVVRLCGRYTVNQIGPEEIAYLLGIYQSLKDGDTTVDALMEPYRKAAAGAKLSQTALKAAKQQADA